MFCRSFADSDSSLFDFVYVAFIVLSTITDVRLWFSSY